MVNLQKLLVEMAVVGAALVVVSLVLSSVQGENVHEVPHLKSMVMGIFLSGALLHLIFEAGGVNDWYVKQYIPLLR